MKVTKSRLDKPTKEKNKDGGAQEESRVIAQHANQWCRDNGYPVPEREYVYRGKWTLKN